MSVLLKKILWYRVRDKNEDGITYENPINITDLISFDINRGLDIRNNVLIFNIKNAPQSFNSDGDVVTKYVDDSFEIKFEEQDQIKLYLNNSDDFSEIEDSAWEDNNTEPSSTFLKGTYYVIEYRTRNGQNGSSMEIKCADKCYVLFSKLVAKAFTKAEGLTSPEIIQKIVRFATENQFGEFTGSGDDANVRYDVDAKLDSESGEIQDTRKATYEDGTANPNTDFPNVSMSKVWKPAYEWINELSQIESINDSDELSASSGKQLVYGRPFLYYVDESNVFHWFEVDTTINGTFDTGADSGIYSTDFEKKVFDTVNFIVFRGGEDLYGNGTLDYYVDETTNVKNLKMRVVAMQDIAKKLIEAEISAGNLVEDNSTPGNFTYSGNRYDRDGTVTALWDNTAYSTDNSYNDALRDEILRLGKQRARSVAKGLASARWSGNMEVKGQPLNVGDLKTITDKKAGLFEQNLRVTGLNDNITRDGWFTTMTLEEDQEAIINSTS